MHGGLEPLVELIKENKDNSNRDNKVCNKLKYVPKNLNSTGSKFCFSFFFLISYWWQQVRLHYILVYKLWAIMRDQYGYSSLISIIFYLVTGALWKVSSNAENVDRLEDLGIVPTLIKVNILCTL